jgi:hypothetical protein
MKTIYESNDGKQFPNQESCIKHETELKKLKKVFNKLVDENFFENYKIIPFFHNREVTTLGKPSKSNWKDKYKGYILVHGRMGNGDTIVTFKLRKNKLLIFRYDTDDYHENGMRYMGSVSTEPPRKLKIKKIMNQIKEEASCIE